jgi:asparagine synthase (glutamine-hydrolysing)
MCGILAVLGGPLPVDAGVADDALDLQRHRGPDDRGVWSSDRAWLGARRLAILDTSSKGHQPMIDGDVVVVFNGEVYNYVELREELRAAGAEFRSGCDTEVVLKSYLQWGHDCLSRFNGMWGLCIFDGRDGSAFFARDRFGVKPLYVTTARERVSVSSEAKSLLHLYPELRRVDEATLYGFLAKAQLHTGESTFYEGIRMVPPGHAGVVEAGARAPRLWRYWRLAPSDDAPRSDAEVDERFRALMEDAVRIRMRSDVPVGVTLSGGLDSTAVAHGAAATLNGAASLTAFTSVWQANTRSVLNDERRWAKLAARPYPVIELEEVPASRGDWLSTLERIAWHLDAPNYSPAVVPLWAIMEAARARGVKVLLEGQGGDELLGGYVHHAALAFIGGLRGRNGGRLSTVRSAPAYARAFLPGAFALWVARELAPFARHSYRARRGTAATLRPEFARRYSDIVDPPAPPTRLNDRLAADLTRDILPALLHYGDGVSMAHSVESRQPFLDYRLVELCLSLPERWKISHGQTKTVLRRYLRAIGQHEVAGRTDKMGFPTPIWQWLAADDIALPRRLLLSPDSRLLAYCTRSGLERLIAHTQREPRTTATHLYRLVSTELWLRACIA